MRHYCFFLNKPIEYFNFRYLYGFYIIFLKLNLRKGGNKDFIGNTKQKRNYC